MNPQRTIGFLFVLLALAGAVNCKREGPKAPVAEEFEPAIPDPVSFVAGNITFQIRDLERKINQSLNPILVSEETFQGKKGQAWRLRVERTGRVRIRYTSGRVSFSAPLRVMYTNPLGLSKNRKHRQLCALSVNFVSPLAVGSNWRLTTRSRFENYEWIKRPTVRLLGVDFGITRLAETLLNKRKADIEAAIDKAVHSELRLDKHVRRVWRDLQKPLRISKKPEEIWIIPRPFSIAAAPVYGNSRQITIPIQIAFRVDTRFGEQPVVTELERLPRLLRRNKLPEASRLEVLAFIPYTDLNHVLEQAMSKQKLDLVGGRVKVKEATIYGGGRSLVLEAKLGGTVNGTLYFHGQPRYDTLTNTLRVKDVDFDVDTKEYLLSTADWLLHDHLRDTLQSVLVVPLNRQIARLPNIIETAFARGKAGKKTDLDLEGFRLVPQRIVIRPDGIQVLIKVESKVAVLIKKL
ncbi:DUF4403 family protein [Spirosoma taeanense]|uniref:DUF4403 family protein n=1 Tax=Spirosoma taeanense TaxID=2735870 RepID=A0A6M5Y749_9BACT|nr:DUF4403 family protein [Spirosoma taeanense]QJW90208.1 DUF4403 family protein [Spirosoma taeanense]